MRLLKRLASVALTLLLLFAIYTLLTTGFFRKINYKFDGKILQQIPLVGAEDIMISTQDSFALVSSTNRKLHQEQGDLFLLDLKANDYTPILLTGDFEQDFAPHGISFYKKDSLYHVMAVNHTAAGHSIEVFELHDQQLTHIKTLQHPSIVHPNDLVMIDENRFYFTNDHRYTKGLGRLIEEYAGLAIANVVYFDGEKYIEVANDVAYANGINFDQKRNLLYVASPRKFLIKVYSIRQDGTLDYIEDIPCGTGVDNIEFDKAGNLWVGAHPSLLRFNAYAQGYAITTPSEIIKISYRAKGDYSIECVYLEKGETMSGSTVAAIWDDLLLVGNVMDDQFLVLQKE